MSEPLRSQLQQTLGDGYTLERELGGGGMCGHADRSDVSGQLSLTLAKGRRMREAMDIAQRLERMDDDIRGIWYGRLSSRLVRGDTGGDLSAIEAAAAGHGDLVPSIILANPWYDAIRTTPRFRAAMRRYHLENSPLVQPRAGRGR